MHYFQKLSPIFVRKCRMQKSLCAKVSYAEKSYAEMSVRKNLVRKSPKTSNLIYNIVCHFCGS